jgi:hypothetical protein
MATSNVLHLPCGHVIERSDHRWVATDGQAVYDTQTCLDIAEGRTPQKFGRDEK